MSEDNSVQISFDDECRIRVLDPEHFKHSEVLEEGCRKFVDKIREFNTSVHSIVEVLHDNAARIDKEKLRAIGQRNKVRASDLCRERHGCVGSSRFHEQRMDFRCLLPYNHFQWCNMDFAVEKCAPYTGYTVHKSG